MRFALTLFCLTISCVTLLAQANANSTGRVEGKVLSQSGPPLANATVRAVRVVDSLPPVDPNYADATTAAISDGRFVFQNLPAGEYKFYADAEGYVRGWHGRKGEFQLTAAAVWVAAEGVAKNVDIVLWPEGSISGRVEGKEQSAVKDAQVFALRFDYVNGERIYYPLRFGKTGADGTFALGGLPRGRYFVMAELPEAEEHALQPTNVSDPEVSSEKRILQSTYYPSEMSPETASVVSVLPGADTAGIEIKLVDTKVYLVCGDVKWLAQKQTKVLALVLAPLDNNPRTFMTAKTARVTADRFCFENVPPGDYSIEPWRMPGPWQNTAVSGTTPLIVGGRNLLEEHFLAVPALQITGSVRWDDSDHSKDPPSGDAVSPTKSGVTAPAPPGYNAQAKEEQTAKLEDSQPPVPAIRVRLEVLGREQINVPEAEFRDAGHFTIHDLPVGHYRIVVENLPSSAFVKSIHYAGHDVADYEIESTSGTFSAPLEVVLGHDAVTVAGRVIDNDGKPISTALVSLLNPLGRPLRAISSDANGEFTFRNLAPGSYSILAWEDLDSPGLATTPRFTQLFATKAVSVSAVGTAASMRVKVVTPDQVERSGWAY